MDTLKSWQARAIAEEEEREKAIRAELELEAAEDEAAEILIKDELATNAMIEEYEDGLRAEELKAEADNDFVTDELIKLKYNKK